ncbi:LAME_0B06084g1_1 [Lachancea meyersii CBS 8951]|uniref:LAME_0B06084g1_1 n=1 Tax=Lachancea meyersii CBS 8951 TaxID=1266667 RepID=A0A1G4IW34_9SACH|nr:LAME_0B06084g1_1 [Lachancea meyersii CBS 8951]
MGDVQLTKAMSIALFERSYDRQFVVDLENSIVSFMDSGLSSYQLVPMNSYYRLLAHQIAEYHGLRHALAKNNDACVVVFKGESFVRATDRPLLQKLDPRQVSRSYKTRESDFSSNMGPGRSRTHSNPNIVAPGQNEEVYEVGEEASSGLPTTPRKSQLAAMDDDSPQPHQFQTSRYRFEQYAEKPRQKKRFHKRSVSQMSLPAYYQPPALAPPFNLPVPYMMYSPYPMMYIPPEHQFPAFPQGPHPFHMSQYANHYPPAGSQITESSGSGSSVFSGRKSESTTENNMLPE